MEQYNTFKGKAYRFLSADALIKTFETKTIRFVRCDQINDPLDCSTLILPHSIEIFKVGGRLLVNSFRIQMNKKIFKDLYICCFSLNYRTDNSYLMWSHYANGHEGLCFEIDYSKTPILGGPSIVNYPESLIESRSILKKQDDIGLFLMTTKSKIWKYEEEVRLIIDKSLPKINSKNFILSENSKYLNYAFDPNIITKVIFGFNCSPETQSYVKSSIQKTGYKPVYENIFVNPNTLQLESEEKQLSTKI